MIQGRLYTSPTKNVRGRAADLWRWPLSLLPLGSGTLLAFAASIGHSSVPAPSYARTTQTMPPAAQSFLRQNCLACHSKTRVSGGLDLTTAFRPEEANNFSLWVKVVDRVSAGEM